MKGTPPIQNGAESGALAPTMRVAVEVTFVQSCEDCRRIVGSLAASCIADGKVTAFRCAPGRKHAHEVTEGVAALPDLNASAAVVAPAALPRSDTNGYDPDNPLDLVLSASSAEINGLDPQN